MNNKKAQMMTFDFSTSIIMFIIFVIIIASITLLNQKIGDKEHFPFELEYVFINFEKNLGSDPGNPKMDFIHNYRIDDNKLALFSQNMDSIDKYVLESTTSTQGIGMYSETYDVCLYFLDNDGKKLKLDSAQNVAVGKLKDGRTCHELISQEKNPCENYAKAVSFFKPVLLDLEDEDESRIIQMNLVFCSVR